MTKHFKLVLKFGILIFFTNEVPHCYDNILVTALIMKIKTKLVTDLLYDLLYYIISG